MSSFLAKIGQALFRSWWVALFFIFCYMIFEQTQKIARREQLELQKQHEQLESEKERLLAKQQELTLQIDSQSDPAWIEMVLMEGLGLVPEGQTKIYFETQH